MIELNTANDPAPYDAETDVRRALAALRTAMARVQRGEDFRASVHTAQQRADEIEALFDLAWPPAAAETDAG